MNAAIGDPISCSRQSDPRYIALDEEDEKSKEYAEYEDRDISQRETSVDSPMLQRQQSFKLDVPHNSVSGSQSVPADDEAINQHTKSLYPTSFQRPPSSKSIRRHSKSQSSKITKDLLSPLVEQNEDTEIKFSSSCIECVKPDRVRFRDELTEGDHIINAGVVYDHHAIIKKVEPDDTDINNKKKAKVTLIHATNNAVGVTTGLSKLFGSKAKIKETVEYFDLERLNIMIVRYLNAPNEPCEIVCRAEEQLQKQDFKYHLFGNNCEHFATYCVTNKRFSVQVGKMTMTLRMFLSRRFVGLSDEKLRNQVAYERELICKPCFERNDRLFTAEKKPIKKMNDVQKGDIITFSYWNLLHDAVVLEVHNDQPGRQNRVDLTYAHYAFCGLSEHRTIKEERKTFPLNGSATVTIYESPPFNLYSPEETIERARSRIGEQQFVFFANDSSHFARWCKLKLNRSS